MSIARVLFVTTRLGMGGAERLLVDLVRRLDRSRYEPVLVCLRDPAALGEELLADGVRTYAKLSGRGRDPTVLARLADVMRQERADVVCTVGTGGDRSFWGRLAARLAGVPVVISCPHSMGQPDRFELSNRLLTGITDAFVAVAHHQKRYLMDEVGLPAGKIHVIHNGVDLDHFRPGPARADLRDELHLPRHAPVAGLVSKLRPEKNVSLFLRAARRVRARVPNARFLIVGDGPMREELVGLTQSLGLSSAVHFAGIRRDVHRLLGAIDVFVLSSLFEAFPLCALEAMACGKPVVATNVGAVCEVVRPDETGYLVPSGDEESLASAVARVLAEPARAARLGRRARQKVEANFGLDSMVRGYQDMFARLLDRKRPRRPAASPRSIPRRRIAPLERATNLTIVRSAASETQHRDRPGWSLLPDPVPEEAIA